jgi:ketosteroid isomerase-like protein
MKMKFFYATAAGLMLLLAGHSVNGQDLTTVKKTIVETNSRYFELFKKKDLALVDLYTADATLLSPNAPAVNGKAALIKDFTTAFADTHIAGVKFTTRNVYDGGKSFVMEQGTWEVLDTDNKVVDTGNYLKMWQKTKTGLKIFRDIFNSDRKGSSK